MPTNPINGTKIEHNKAVARQILKAFSSGDFEAVRELVGPGVVSTSRQNVKLKPGETPSGAEASTKQVKWFRNAFSDLRFEEVALVAEDDKVILCWKMTGTNTGRIFGREPTGRKISHHGVEIMEFQDGMLVKHSDIARPLEFADKLGLLDSELLDKWKELGIRNYNEE